MDGGYRLCPRIGLHDGAVGMKVKAEGNAKFFKVVMPEQQ